MKYFLKTFWRGLFTNGARTGDTVYAPRLDDRVYDIPFDQVWSHAVELALNGLPRWRLIYADDHEGIIRAEVMAARFRPALRVTIRIGLDADAQTCLAAEAVAPESRADLGAAARALAHFLGNLDRILERDAVRPGPVAIAT